MYSKGRRRIKMPAMIDDTIQLHSDENTINYIYVKCFLMRGELRRGMVHPQIIHQSKCNLLATKGLARIIKNFT